MVFLLRLLVAKTLPSVHCLRAKRRSNTHGPSLLMTRISSTADPERAKRALAMAEVWGRLEP